jgi:hypothetical protein
MSETEAAATTGYAVWLGLVAEAPYGPWPVAPDEPGAAQRVEAAGSDWDASRPDLVPRPAHRTLHVPITRRRTSGGAHER